MLKAIAGIFTDLRAGDADLAAASDHELQLATALLLVELARADYSLADIEQDAIVSLLASHFSLSESEVRALVEQAEAEADHAASLQGFTRKLNDELDRDGKLRIVEMLWEVAFADDELSKYEDSLVRKLGDLLYVPHREQIRLRNKVVRRRRA